MIPQQDINNLRNTLANAYTTLDSYLRQDDLKAEATQLMVAKLLNIVIEKAFYLHEEGGEQ